MVEGPGCKLNGLKLRKRGKGQKVIAISGNVLKKTTGDRAVSSPFEQLNGLVMLDVKTLGKELFALFEDDVCLRVHFLMQGSVRYNNEPKEFGDGNSSEPRLKLHMSKDEISFFDSAVEIRSCAECLERHALFIDLDICSETFNSKRAVQTIMEHSERLVCDVILDQLVLPGVGNIIKNEALFDAGINPNTKVKDLNEDLVSHLVKMNRDFTSIFYKCRKEGRNLRKNMRVYEKAKCPECGGPITRCKIGEYERLTFFCRSCQTNTMKTDKKLAMKNSLLGWVKASKIQVPWNCSVCTLENKPANIKCNACLTPKPTSVNEITSRLTGTVCNLSSASLKNEINHLPIVPPHLTTIPSREAEKMNDGIYKNEKRPLDNIPDNSCKIGKYTFKRLCSGSSEKSSILVSSQLSPSGVRLQGFPACVDSNVSSVQKDYSRIMKGNQEEDAHGKDEQIVCTGHKNPARKAVVKHGENKGRVFYSCSFHQMKQCKFFMWADDHHPFCCHGKITVIRTVMKLNSNNGRQFYCCSMPKPKQCDFFEWVDKKS